MTAGKAFIFINEEQAAGFGHIGWGFQLSADSFYFGSTDHLWRTDYPLWHPLELLRYMNVNSRENNDYWSNCGSLSEMLETMRRGPHVRYHLFKTIDVAEVNPLVARGCADSMSRNGWNIVSNNCVHQTFSIVTTFGASLPSPYKIANLFPKSWFAAIEAETSVLEPSSGRVILPSTAHRRRRAG
jgi:hypothetical protein